VMDPLLVTAHPGLAGGATPVPAELTVALLTTVALVVAVAQPAAPSTMAPFAPVMVPLTSQVACAALPRASKAIGSVTALTALRFAAAISPGFE